MNQIYNKADVSVADGRLFLLNNVYTNDFNLYLLKETLLKIDNIASVNLNDGGFITIKLKNPVNDIGAYYDICNMAISLVLQSGKFDLETSKDRICYKSLLNTQYDRRIYYSLSLLNNDTIVYQF